MTARTAWALALIALALVLAWWLLRERGEPRSAEPASKARETAQYATGATPDLPPSAPAAPPNDPLHAHPTVPDRPPYPPNSQPLTEGSDPATAPPEDDPVDPASGLHVVLGPRRDVVHPPDPI